MQCRALAAARAAQGLDRLRHDPRIEIVPHNSSLNAEAILFFAARHDKDWSPTDCLSFIIIGRRSIRDALTADNHFEQVGFHALLTTMPPSVSTP